jgi:hypothetical protein
LSGIPSDPANRGKTGLLDIVELKMARPPMIQSSRNGVILIWNFIYFFLFRCKISWIVGSSPTMTKMILNLSESGNPS